MDAMAMTFRVNNSAELAGLTPGSRINFRLNVARTRSWISGIRVRQPADADVFVSRPEGQIAIGGHMPDFVLTDQTSRTVRLSDFRGRVVVMDFIYTRCPLPDVCPRLSANFALLAKRFGDRLTLLSVTIDPQFDTPQILAVYAHRWRAGQNWHFLTGTDEAIRRVANCMGLIYWPEEGVVSHTAATAVIGRDGRLAARLEGSSFTAQQLVDLVQSEETTP
jgi:protein SCO1/2